MYEYIRGELVEITKTEAIVEVNGIGYKIFVPIQNGLPVIGSKVTLYTYFVVKEDDHALYGFCQKEEREVFEKLLSISGIGPKTALNLIGHMTLSHLAKAIQRNDITAFTKVPGVGKKTAERLLLELRGKLDDITFIDNSPSDKKILDAEKALINLGYSRNLARKALEKAMKELPEESDLSSLIALALKNKS